MEAAVRHLRDGALPDGSACATCCVLDNLGVVGGALVLRNALQSFISAMRQGRSQASSIRLVDLTGALADLATPAAGSRPGNVISRHAPGDDATARPLDTGRDLELVDLFSDPWGWRQETAEPSLEQLSGSASVDIAPQSALPTPTPTPTPAPPTPSTSLEALQSALLCPPAAGPPASAVGSSGSRGGGRKPGAAVPEADPAAAADTAVGGSSRSVCIVIGCLSTLMERYGAWQALRLLEAVQRSPVVSCVLTAMHTDLHPDQLVFALRRLSTCTLDLSPLTALQTEVAQQALAATDSGNGGSSGNGGGGALAGRLDCRTKRRTGRVKVDSELYSILPPAEAADGSSGVGSTAARLAFHPVPPVLDAPDPKALVRLQPPTAPPAALLAAAPAAAAAPGGGAGGGGSGQAVGLLGGVSSAEELARAVGSSMRLTLTEEERRAKEQVVLPYQHTGHRGGSAGAGGAGGASATSAAALAAAYAAGDHAAYLPPAAGGTGPAAGGGGQQALGHILYVRDSGSEADSDQELDEDLDI